MYPQSSKDLNKETDEAIYFFTPAFHCLDNFSAHQINIWGKMFLTAEHAFQWKKLFEVKPELADEIFKATSPEFVKQISDTHKSEQPKNWEDCKVAIMEEILTAKAKQHQDVQEVLIRSGKRMIAENSPVDSFWGFGPDGKGKNMVGVIWMRVRENAIK